MTKIKDLTGIYFIKCIVNNRMYIGSSINIDIGMIKIIWR